MQSVSSMTRVPPEPIIAPAWEGLVVDRGVGQLAGMQPPDGPPIWTALNFLPVLDAAANLVNDLGGS